MTSLNDYDDNPGDSAAEQGRRRAAGRKARIEALRSELEAFKSMPDSIEKYVKARELSTGFSESDQRNEETRIRNAIGNEALSVVDNYREMARQYISQGGGQGWQSAISEYNTDGRVSNPLFSDVILEINRYHEQGQANPGKLTDEMARNTFAQWRQDAAPGGWDRAGKVISSLVAGYVMGTVGGAMISALGGTAGATATGGGLTAEAANSTAALSGGAGAGQGLSAATLGTSAATSAGASGGLIAAGAGEVGATTTSSMPLTSVEGYTAGSTAGTTAGATTTSLTSQIVDGAVNGAVNGAAQGALTAGMTGGDIGEGITSGAIGGAVGGVAKPVVADIVPSVNIEGSPNLTASIDSGIQGSLTAGAVAAAQDRDVSDAMLAGGLIGAATPVINRELPKDKNPNLNPTVQGAVSGGINAGVSGGSVINGIVVGAMGGYGGAIGGMPGAVLGNVIGNEVLPVHTPVNPAVMPTQYTPGAVPQIGSMTNAGSIINPNTTGLINNYQSLAVQRANQQRA